MNFSVSPKQKSAARPIKRSRRVPPGQRLLGYILFASIGVALQGFLIPAEAPSADITTETADKQVLVPPFLMLHNLDDLQKTLQQECNKPKLSTGVFAVNPVSGQYVNMSGQETFSAASIIKLPIFTALMQAIDKQQVSMDEILTIKPDLVGGGSGYLQWRAPNSKISLKDTVELMIKISDNTATNMIIDRLGGMKILNKQFDKWGLTKTRLNNPLPDFDGTNTTSPYDLVCLLGQIDRGDILTPASKKYMYEVLERTHTRTLLPPGLGPGAKIAHKTGDIASMVGDAGIVTAASGQRYFVAVQVTRPTNDLRANKLIRDVSKSLYDDFIQKQVSQ